jgi:2-keto-4-pentenoate hydratase/2-oxohepta-3-ene-1,7-dioic acid hydratase in catechol pathway
MRYATVLLEGRPEPAALAGDRLLSFRRMAHDTGLALPGSLLDTVLDGDDGVRRAYGAWLERFDPDSLPLVDPAAFARPFRPPGKIWGIGLNYRDHARDLDEEVPPEPASFLKPASSAIGHGDVIPLPAVSQRVTAEAELALILGRRARNVSEDDALDAVFGYTTVLDMTAEDILRVNPRFLTRAKSFDGFFSFGPVLVTRDEIGDPAALTVRIAIGGKPGPANQVRNMTYGPADLVAFHSRGMTWEPGDILSTGTPGAVVIAPGDEVTCQIEGIGVLRNRVA